MSKRDKPSGTKPNTRRRSAERDAEVESELAELRRAVAALQADRDRLVAELETVRNALGRALAQNDELLRRLEKTDDQDRALLEQYQLVEEQNASLANLYVASHRLHESLERDGVLGAIQEIVINLIGSEEFGIYELTRHPSALTLLSSFGLDTDRFRSLPVDAGVVAEAVQSGEVFVAQGDERRAALAHEAGVTACVPMKLGTRVIGAIVIFSLLPHKPAYTPLDRELFALLATHAGVALHRTRLQPPASLAST